VSSELFSARITKGVCHQQNAEQNNIVMSVNTVLSKRGKV